MKNFGNGRGSWEAHRSTCSISTGQRALIPNNRPKIMLRKRDSASGAQPVGHRPTDCISLQIQSHVKSLAEESRAENDDVCMLLR